MFSSKLGAISEKENNYLQKMAMLYFIILMNYLVSHMQKALYNIPSVSDSSKYHRIWSGHVIPNPDHLVWQPELVTELGGTLCPTPNWQLYGLPSEWVDQHVKIRYMLPPKCKESQRGKRTQMQQFSFTLERIW